VYSPFTRINEIVQQTSSPHSTINDHCVVHRLWRWVRPTNWYHREHNPEDQKDDRCPRNRNTEFTGIERTWFEFLLAPNDSAQDWNSPGDVVARDSKREERLCGCRRNQGKETENCSSKHASPNRTERDIAKGLANGPEESREWKGSVTRESPCLTTRSNYYKIRQHNES
jgi:hypothetical protein